MSLLLVAAKSLLVLLLSAPLIAPAFAEQRAWLYPPPPGITNGNGSPPQAQMMQANTQDNPV